MSTPIEELEELNSLPPGTVIPARKPDPGWFVHVRPGAEWQTTTTSIDVWGRGLYLVSADLAAGLPGAEFTQLFTTMNHHGIVFLWPVSVTALMGRPRQRRAWLPTWPPEALAELPPPESSELPRKPAPKDPRSPVLQAAITERRAVWTAEQRWVGVFYERWGHCRTYDYNWVSKLPLLSPPPPLPESVWPAWSFQELFNIGFKDRCICSLDDPIVEHVLFQAYAGTRGTATQGLMNAIAEAARLMRCRATKSPRHNSGRTAR